MNADESRCQEDQQTASQKSIFYDLKEDASKKVRKVKFWAELIALIVLIIYTRATLKTNKLTQCALNISKQQFAESQRISKEQFKTAQNASAKQFQTDQRPYVWNSAIKADLDDKSGIVFAEVYLMDFGKSPAINERGGGAVFVGKHSLAEADNWFKERDKSGLKDSPATIIPPGIPGNPFQTQAVAAIHSDAASVSDFKYAAATNDAIVIVARFEYFDGSGENFYRSDMCWTRQVTGRDKAGRPTGRLAPCEQHNHVK